MPYPTWTYYPLNVRAAPWVAPFLGAVEAAESNISTEVGHANRPDSDTVLRFLGPSLEALGYQVERGKAASDKIKRPVLFGENGHATVQYEIDAVHDGHGVVVEVEAGRGARGNAAYRDLVRTSLILDARFFTLMLPLVYRYGQKQANVLAYRDCRELLNAVYASQRLRLPFEGVLLVGY